MQVTYNFYLFERLSSFPQLFSTRNIAAITEEMALKVVDFKLTTYCATKWHEKKRPKRSSVYADSMLS